MSFSTQRWQNFSALNGQIVKALRKAGFQKPTNIQAQVLEQYRHYFDFLIASQTGSGKTLAFALPIISQLTQFTIHHNLSHLPRALFGLIITPTRELAQQIQANIKTILQNFDNSISILSIIGGMSKHRQLRVIRQRQPHIIIGTPGRIHQFLEDGVFNFDLLKYLVIDQADRMIELGHYDQVDKILSKIFRPKVKQFYQKDFHQITSSIANRQRINNDKELTKNKKEDGLYLKHNGKKVKINFNLHSIQADKLFQVPAELFKFIDGGNLETFDAAKKSLTDGLPGKKGKTLQMVPQPQVQAEHFELKQAIPENTTLFKQLTDQELFLVNKLKRRIFFVSATLTRQFKGQKYKMKRREQDQKPLTEGKHGKKDKNSKQKKGGVQNDEELASIPKLRALLSRVNFSSKPKIIDQSSQLFLPAGLCQKISVTDGQNQRISVLLCYLSSLDKKAKIIIFANTIKASKRIQFFIDAFDYKCSILHSHMQQKLRMTKLQRFKKSQTINILISTDVAARGLDFFVSNVVQYGVPTNGDTYVHRAGRTARANRSGEALIITDRKQGNRWIQINDTLNGSAAKRKVEKYCPPQIILEEVQQKVTKFQWVRVNNQKMKDSRNMQLEEQEADQLGIQVQQQQTRKKYDLDKQEEAMVRHQVKRKVQNIKKFSKNSQSKQKEAIKWKKNRLVLSPEQIMKMM